MGPQGDPKSLETYVPGTELFFAQFFFKEFKWAHPTIPHPQKYFYFESKC